MKQAAILLMLIPAMLFAEQYHVTTTGTIGGAGTIGSPWSIARGFDVNAFVHPLGGDTLWIHGGQYFSAGLFDCELSGTSNSNPVIVRNWNNEHVEIIGTSSHGDFPSGVQGNEEWTFLLRGEFLWVWGLDISANTTDAGDATNVIFGGQYGKLIGCYIHNGQAVGVTSQQVIGTEVIDCIVNYNGREQTADEGVGYGAYVQNVVQTPRVSKSYINTMFFYNWGWNWQAYTVAGTNDSLILEKCVLAGAGLFWQRGYPSSRSWGPQFVINGPNNFARWLQLKNSHFFQDQSLISGGGGNFFGLFSTTTVSEMTMTGNFMAGSNAASFDNVTAPNTVTGNVFVGTTAGVSAGYPSNTFLSSWPSTRPDDIFVYRHKYELNRAHIVAWNWDESATISVNPNADGTVLNNGDTYVVKDALNPWGASVASGTWTTGNNIAIPMTGLTAAMPVWPDTNEIPPPLHGWRKTKGDEYFQGQTPPHTAPRFAGFIIIGGGTIAAEPTINVSVSSLGAFSSTVPDPSASQNYTVSGTDLTANIVITAPTDFQVSTDNTNWFSSRTLTQSGGVVSATTIYARLNRATAGTSNGNITHTSTGATTRNVAVTGTATVTPNIIVSSNGPLTFNSVTPNASTSQNITISGTGLTTVITCTAPTDFQVSTNNVTWASSVTYTPSGGVVNNQPLYIRMNRQTAGSPSGDVACTSTGAVTENIAVSGTATDPPVVRRGSILVKKRRE